MTAKRRTIPGTEIESHAALLVRLGLMPAEIGAVDIRADGVTFIAKGESAKGSAFDVWKQKDARRDRTAHS